jgi:formylglycine-generating enzyme
MNSLPHTSPWLRLALIAGAAICLIDARIAFAIDPTCTIREVKQRPGTQLVDITYDLVADEGADVTVTMQYSVDQGATWNDTAVSVTTTRGAYKHLTWNAGADWPNAYAELARVKLCASTGGPPPAGMVLIPSGSFVMGATTNVGHEGYSGEIPQHTVDVSAFYMDRYEVTKGLWDEVANWASSHGYDIGAANGSGKATDHPVQTVTWYECVKWCNARSENEGLTPCYYTSISRAVVYRSGATNIPIEAVDWSANGYRLPTEAEWEKAARGGVAGHRFPWSDSDTIQHARANYFSSSSYFYDTSPTRGYHPSYSSGGTPYTSPSDSFTPNGYRLYNMAGNVLEWCWDWYDATYYGSSLGSDPRGPTVGSYRVLRGGGWSDDARNARCAGRNGSYPSEVHYNYGFRCVIAR